MLRQIQKNIFIYKFLTGLTPVGFTKFTISHVTFNPKENDISLGTAAGERFIEKLEGKIVIKAWKEIEKNFPYCVLGDYSLKTNSFSGIIMVDNEQVLDNPRKFIPKALTSFKNRSTLLLNQFHGTHGRVFWANNYQETFIEDIHDLKEALSELKVSYVG
ncbi:MAG: hypothetical protein L0Y79_01635 [Chlorobi bacterium]|nr:hypothetical protein [Chlorobiota bacterium]MCI0716878.1 hypothetical protein [Chlorobiota bacterium]